MTKSKAVVYMALSVAAISTAIAVRLYADTIDPHEYASRRSAVPQQVTFSEKALAERLPHAFAFRPMARNDGSHGLSFNTGYCLLAYRHQQGLEPTPEDKLLAEAVVRLMREPWFQELTLGTVGGLKGPARWAADDSAEARDELLRIFVASIRANPKFDIQLRHHLAQAAEDWGWPIEWK